MNNFLTTDGNNRNKVNRDFAVSKKNNANSVKKAMTGSESESTVNTEELTSEVSIDEAYALPQDFDRLSAIVKKEDVKSWLDSQMQAVEDAQEKTTAEKDTQAKDVFGNTANDYAFAQKLLDSMREAREKYKETEQKQKKELVYEYQKVSGSIARAKTINQASTAIRQAKANLINVRRKGATGQYDEAQLAMAINHAKKMVQIANKKLNNLKQESTMSREKPRPEETEKLLKQRKNQKKNAHRKEENAALMQADMDYLKHYIQLMSGGGYPASSEISTGASQISPVAQAAGIQPAAPTGSAGIVSMM